MADTLPSDNMRVRGKRNGRKPAEGIRSAELAIDPSPLDEKLDKTSNRVPDTVAIPRVAQNAPNKRQKRDDYRNAHKDVGLTELPKKKFYRQRAHANPFSDHQLT